MFLSIRSKYRFISFVVVYSALAWLIAVPLRNVTFADMASPSFYSLQDPTSIRLIITVITAIIIAMLYGFLLSFFRKMEIATLKCIGWGNTHVRTLIIGEILFVSTVGYLLLLELDIHILGINQYVPYVNVSSLIFGGDALLLTLIIIVFCQIPGVLVANYRILKVRPIVALKAK